MAALRAAGARPRALGGDGQKTRAVARDLFDAAARHRTELVHAPFYGVRCVILQTSGLAPFNSRKDPDSPPAEGRPARLLTRSRVRGATIPAPVAAARSSRSAAWAESLSGRRYRAYCEESAPQTRAIRRSSDPFSLATLTVLPRRA